MAFIALFYRVLKTIWQRMHPWPVIGRLFVLTIFTSAICLIAIVAVAYVYVAMFFSTIDDQETFISDTQKLPITSLDNSPDRFIEDDWLDIGSAGIGTKLASLEYGFHDVPTVQVFQAPDPDQLIGILNESPHNKRIENSLWEEKLLCGSRGERQSWSINSKSLKEFHQFCAEAFSNEAYLTTLEFMNPNNNSSLSISRLGETSFFTVRHCFRCY
jgi:hypothetical protein